MNPFLPEGEYIPDAEPYIFGDRVYIYGSHDQFGAPIFCTGDYMAWSAPVDSFEKPGAWRCDGVLYRKTQDPLNTLGLRLLFAPDVCQGPDGRFYLYYAFDFMGIMGVAVADSPAGPFEFYGHVRHADGTLWGRRAGDSFPFDPAVMVDDDGRVYLYSGFYTPVSRVLTGGRKLNFPGGVAVELCEDMVTLKGEEELVFPREDGEFFEASSIRKIGAYYYFVYSSQRNHELKYAVSSRPTGGFEYAGTLVSIGDLGLNGVEDERHADNYLGNTHGGLLQRGEDFYIFYHRQTNRTSYARQACAEKLSYTRDERGILHFQQAEITTRGADDTPVTLGVSEDTSLKAYTACTLWAGGHETLRYDEPMTRAERARHPYFTQERDEYGVARQYIANMTDGATCGFKYVSAACLTDVSSLCVRARARRGAVGELVVHTVSADAQRSILARIPVNGPRGLELGLFAKPAWTVYEAPAYSLANLSADEVALYATYEGSGAVDVLDIFRAS